MAIRLSTNLCPVRSLCRSLQIIRAAHKPMQRPLVSHTSFLTSFRLAIDTTSLFVSPRVEPAPAMVKAPSNLEKDVNLRRGPNSLPPNRNTPYSPPPQECLSPDTSNHPWSLSRLLVSYLYPGFQGSWAPKKGHQDQAREPLVMWRWASIPLP